MWKDSCSFDEVVKEIFGGFEVIWELFQGVKMKIYKKTCPFMSHEIKLYVGKFASDILRTLWSSG